MVKKNKKIRVGLIIDEFFGAANTAYGGYGFLARRYISKYIPNEKIHMDVLLGKGKKKYISEKYEVDGIKVYRLPKKTWFAKQWLNIKKYDIYLSIELTNSYVLENDLDAIKKLILWIQDPRPLYEWKEINTVKIFPERCYYDQKIYDLVNNWHNNDRVRFISQGYFLNQKAKDLYRLNDNVAIDYVPNPIKIDDSFDVNTYQKDNMIIFLGRVESVKRGWLFCEIAKSLPQYEFYILGQTFREKTENNEIMEKYYDVKNIHFSGHVDGNEKDHYLKNAKILVNTSIHEALPISFLEALSFGTLLVSNRNPENLTSKFGIHVGEVLGDGFDKVDLYVDAIKNIMENEAQFKPLRHAAIEYIKENHNINDFINSIHNIIDEELGDK